ncbi:hypothetical protein ACJMK2_027273 [Sinanodonta woodiana]|uniref:Zinc finger PHD-type domain-containing protein n=1 Tax=Sinanodonta woodiana TaxID=1069815 RepID=A0ABD3XMA2_SINWO
MAYVRCIHCAREVRPRQHLIACDVCGFWQHRTCRTGISLLAYRDAVNNKGKIGFTCRPCREMNQIPVNTYVTDHDKEDSVNPPFLELSVSV